MIRYSAAERRAIHGGLSKPAKMRGATSYGLPARVTCPVGSRLIRVAESVCSKCYGDNRGNYCRPNVKAAQARRLDCVKAAIGSFLGLRRFIRAMSQDLTKPRHRWHDTGDTFDPRYALAIVAIARRTPEVSHHLPTKERGMWRNMIREYRDRWPRNLVVRVSALKFGAPPPLALSGLCANAVDSGQADHACPVRGGDDSCEAHGCFVCWDPEVYSVDFHRH